MSERGRVVSLSANRRPGTESVKDNAFTAVGTEVERLLKKSAMQSPSGARIGLTLAETKQLKIYIEIALSIEKSQKEFGEGDLENMDDDELYALWEKAARKFMASEKPAVIEVEKRPSAKAKPKTLNPDFGK